MDDEKRKAPYRPLVLTEDKWIRVMAVYGNEFIFWDRQGSGCSSNEIPLDQDLAHRLLQWSESYGDRNDYTDAEWAATGRTLDLKAYAATGLALAREIKLALPDWTILYFDVSKVDYNDLDKPRHIFEYEI